MNTGLGGLDIWVDVFPNADRLAIDTHPYFAFSGTPNTEPMNVAAPDGEMGGIWPARACTTWKPMMDTRCATISFLMSFFCRRLTDPSKFKQFRCHHCRRIQQRLQRLWLLHEECRALYHIEPRLRILE